MPVFWKRIDSVRKKAFFKALALTLTVVAVIFSADFALSEIADISAYENTPKCSEAEWNGLLDRAQNGRLDSEAYSLIFNQTGLGSAADSVIEKGVDGLNTYRDYFTAEKDYICHREGIFAHHEAITDADGKPCQNPDFADLEDGDILITLSIHSLGWRHGHAAVVTDAESGATVEATMFGEKSGEGNTAEWRSYPFVAVLRAKDLSKSERESLAEYAKTLAGLNYSLLAGVFENSKTTHCAHLVKLAFDEFGVDIDSNGGKIITPLQILKSENLEIVQIYGNTKECEV